MTKPIKNLLSHLLFQSTNWKTQLLKNWPELLGDMSSQVTLEKIYEDTLLLSVQNSSWLQELYLLSPMLIKTINKTLDQPRIKHLRFKTRGIKKDKQREIKKIIKHTQEIPLTSSESSALKKIDDPQLQQALKRFLMRCHRENV